MVSPRAAIGPRWYHSTSASPAASTRATTSAGSWRTKSRSTGASNHSSRWRTSDAGVQGDDQPAAGEQRPRERGQGVGELGRGQVDQGVPREHGGPARAVRRAHQPAQVADLVAAVREAPARLRDHPRRQVEAERVGAGLGEVRRDVTRAAADLDHRAAVGVRGDPVEQPALERLAEQLVDQVVGVRRWRRRRRTTGPAGRGPRRRRRAPTRGRPRARPRGRCPRSPRRRRAGAPSGRRAGRAGGAARGPAARAGRPGPARHASTAPRSAKACSRSVRVFSSPGACAPRSSSTVTSARSASDSASSAVEELVVLQRPPPGVGPHDAHQPAVLESAQRRLDGRLVVVDDRVAAAGLVAAGAHRGERHRVRRRDGHLLLEQHAEDPLLLGVELGEGHAINLDARRNAQHRPSRVDLRVDPFPRGLRNGRISAARPVLRWGAVSSGVPSDGGGSGGDAPVRTA